MSMAKRQFTRENISIVAHLIVDKCSLGQRYHDRVDFECAEIDKQGYWTNWISFLNDRKKFDNNPNKLVLPWLFKMLVVRVDESKYRQLTEQEWLAADPIATRDPTKDGPLLTTSHYAVISAILDEQAALGKEPKLPIDIRLDADKPDIDLDCLPAARNPIKQRAAAIYNNAESMESDEKQYGKVCSVGTWTTYKFKSALQDVHRAYGHTEKSGKQEILNLTTNLPEDVDDLVDGGYSVCKNRVMKNKEEVDCGKRHNAARCPDCGSDATETPTIGKLLDQYDILRDFHAIHPDIVDCAVNLVGRIRNMGMHAGAIIISDRAIYGRLPLSAKRAKKGEEHFGEAQWISMWTEGRNTQLSKFGFTKWDILGLKNLQYISRCCELIEKSSGGTVTFRSGNNPIAGWDFADPINDIAGYYWTISEGERYRHNIRLNDPDALKMASESMTDGIFQFDTQLAKQILHNGVRNFNDLMLFNAMGHPGPMDSIPEAVANREASLIGDDTWKDRLRDLDPIFLEELESTYGIICFQETLANLWQRIAGFTAPEAQDARKAVAKKWRHQLVPIEKKWIDGASRKIGEKAAKEWWVKMENFGRYAFNKSHAVSYSLVAYKCLWLKAHHPAEWWAAVMSDCNSDKLTRYIAVAKSEKQADLGTLNINHLTYYYTVTPKARGSKLLPQINPGLIGIKGIGDKTAKAFEGDGDWKNIDEFVEAKPKSKAVLERLIKLGAFCHLHSIRRGTWVWYLYKYGSSTHPEVKETRRIVDLVMRKKMKWSPEAIEAERRRLAEAYHKQFPKRRIIPRQIANWQPKLVVGRDDVISMFKEWSHTDILDFEKKYVGYYLSNPLKRYHYDGSLNIANAKSNTLGIVHAVVTGVEYAKTKKAETMCRVKLNDGQDEILLLVWSDDCNKYNEELTAAKTALETKGAPEVGVQIAIKWSAVRKSATLFRVNKYQTGCGPIRSISLLEPIEKPA